MKRTVKADSQTKISVRKLLRYEVSYYTIVDSLCALFIKDMQNVPDSTFQDVYDYFKSDVLNNIIFDVKDRLKELNLWKNDDITLQESLNDEEYIVKKKSY